jgi:energy-coupling factor transporter ATP-binding protein EcfA2
LLRLLSGLLSPASGRVFVRGTEHPDVHNQVGILFQNPDHQMLAATVEEELALGLELRGVSPDVMRSTVENLLSRFQLEPFRNHSPQALSGGQKQRVALAAIMAVRPQFLLFDEPDSYLDAPSRRELLSAVEEIRADCGIIWATPHPRHMPLAERFALVRDGTLRECSEEELRIIASKSSAPS